MKTASTALTTHLQGNPTTTAFLWKVKRTDGVIFGFTNFDRDIAYDDLSGDGSITYLAKTGFINSASANKSDLTVDNSEVQAFLDSTAITAADIRGTRYDDALITIMLVNWNDLTMGHVILRKGTLGIVKLQDPARGVFSTEIRGLADQLRITIGASFGPLCRAEFGSGLNGIDMNSKYLCHIDVTALQQTAAVSVVNSPTQIGTPNYVLVIPASLPGAGGHPGYDFFNEGLVTFTSGVMNGMKFEIKDYEGSTEMTDPQLIEFFMPLPFTPAIGDTFIIEPGCDKTLGKCQFYNNVVNFRGEPFIPGMDIFLDYPGAGPNS